MNGINEKDNDPKVRPAFSEIIVELEKMDMK